MSYQEIGDHPDVARALATGYPNGKTQQYPVCPVCGEDCETMYKDWYGRYIGCNVCVSTVDAWDVEDCFPVGW